MTDGLFSPDSAMWRLNRERFVLLGGASAAILQAAHPMVAMGVAAHSSFRDDTIGRLRRTLDAVYMISFGTREDAEQVMRNIRTAHARVRGDSPQKYSAMDSDAQMWVLATLIMTTVEMHRRFAAPPDRADCGRFYADMRVFGRCFGLDPAFGPQTWDEFTAYYEEMLCGPLLGSHPLCSEVACAIVLPRRPLVLRWLAPLLAPFACAYVPEPLRTRLRLPWRERLQPVIQAMERSIAWLLPMLPDCVRFAPAYRRAASRIVLESARQKN